MKAFTPNGYKQVTIMCFGDSVNAIARFRPGSVVQIINPRLMKVGGAQHGIAFSIDSEHQFKPIGTSEDFNVCTGKQSAKGPGGEQFRCRAFLNKSVEDICDKHKMEREAMRVDRVKAHRPGLMGDRVDSNAIKRV